MTTTETPPRRSRTGRPPLTSRKNMLAAGRRIGFARLTVGAITNAVERKYSTFYRHFPSLDAFIAALVDDVLDDVQVPDGATWREHLDHVAEKLAAAVRDWPGLAAAIDHLIELGQTPVRLAEVRDQAAAALADAGVRPDHAAEAVGTVLSLATLDPVHACPGGVGLVLDGLAARIRAAA